MRNAELVLLILLAGGLGSSVAFGGGNDEQAAADKQAELDQRCEAAREIKLAPIREDIYRECLDKKQGDAAYCRRYADAYNGNRPGGAPRFYELPECEAAFKFRNSP
jgi:hypothetical protein